MTDRDADIAEAMRAGRRGDAPAYRRALAEIARMIRPRIRRRFGASGGAAEDGEDVVQEVLLAIHLKNETWDDARPILPWVFAIADHKALDVLRRRGRAARLIDSSVTAEDVAERVAAPVAERDLFGLDLERHLSGLPRREREVVSALTVEGVSIAACAQRLGLKAGAVRVALHRGLKRLSEAARAAREP